MQLQLRQPVKKLIAVALLCLSAAYLTLSTAQFLAAHFSGVPDAVHLRRAVWLDPGSAEYRYRLGRYELLAPQSPQTALPWLESATALNPYRARYWIDLAIARESLGDTASEKQALQHALSADPRTPDIAWEAANLYLAQGSADDAMREYGIVLQNDPYLTLPAISTCWKIRPDIDFLLDNVVPSSTNEAFLDFLVSKDESSAAAKVWERMFSSQQPVSHGHLFDYMRHLIAHREVPQAALVWQQAASLSGLAAYQGSSENLLVNGDFSLEILNGGFDWLHQKVRGVNLALDPNETHSSSRSLRIVFDGPGIEDAGIRQLVPVEPGTNYEFSGFYKAQDMDGAGGPQLAVQDLYHETAFFMSEELRDADFWKKTGGRFTTGPDTHLIVVRIARVPAGSPIRGKLWIDGLKLVRSEDLPASAKKETP
jgi:tetratricopeptide (TPR) repeat protein